MSTSIRQVNSQAYGFVQCIVNKFDAIKFPETTSQNVVEPFPYSRTGLIYQRELLAWNDKEQKYELSVPSHEEVDGRKLRHTLSKSMNPDVMSQIASHATNFSHWALITGITDPACQSKDRSRYLESCAKPILDRFNIRRGIFQSHTDLLLGHVFETVFARASMEEKLEIVSKMKSCTQAVDKLDRFSFRAKMLLFKVQVKVAIFFRNWVVQYVTGLIVAELASQFYKKVAQSLFYHGSKYYFPKTINFLINHASLEVIRMLSGLVAVVQYVFYHQIQMWLACWFLVKIARNYHFYAQKVKAVLLFPSTLSKMPSIIFNKAFAVNSRLQNALAESAQNQSDQSKQNFIIEEAPKAYEVWMYLMKNPEALYDKNSL